VTQQENLRRGAINQYIGRDTCSKGHEYTPENTQSRPSRTGTGIPSRVCVACARAPRKASAA
jgi:hypothetical protein